MATVYFKVQVESPENPVTQVAVGDSIKVIGKKGGSHNGFGSSVATCVVPHPQWGDYTTTACDGYGDVSDDFAPGTYNGHYFVSTPPPESPRGCAIQILFREDAQPIDRGTHITNIQEHADNLCVESINGVLTYFKKFYGTVA